MLDTYARYVYYGHIKAVTKHEKASGFSFKPEEAAELLSKLLRKVAC